MKVTSIFSILLLAPLVFAGQELKRVATTHQQREIAEGLIYGGTVLMMTVVGIIPGTAMIAADNEDGSRSCWTKILDRTDITDETVYDKYAQIGLPVKMLLEHADAAIYAPVASCPARVVLRNRRAECFILRPTVNDENGFMYHVDPVPKMITWH